MILSHKHKFIFIKTNKTAGTSIEIALSKFCGPDDIITRISPEDEKTRKKLGYRTAQNFLPRPQGKPVFYNHMSASEIKSEIGEWEWRTYYKFCFERNPWDRVISLYYWRKYNNEKHTESIEEFVASNLPLLLKQRGSGLYTINGSLIVDKVCKFENLEKEMKGIQRKLGLEGKIKLPHAKSQSRKDKRNYREILGPKECSRIGELFTSEIRMMGYGF